MTIDNFFPYRQRSPQLLVNSFHDFCQYDLFINKITLVIISQVVYWFGRGSCRISDLSFTNSFATSSLLRCDKMRNIVQPVSSI